MNVPTNNLLDDYCTNLSSWRRPPWRPASRSQVICLPFHECSHINYSWSAHPTTLSPSHESQLGRWPKSPERVALPLWRRRSLTCRSAFTSRWIVSSLRESLADLEGHFLLRLCHQGGWVWFRVPIGVHHLPLASVRILLQILWCSRVERIEILNISQWECARWPVCPECRHCLLKHRLILKRAIPIKSETTKAFQNASKPTAFIVSGALPALTINIHERSHVVISQAR